MRGRRRLAAALAVAALCAPGTFLRTEVTRERPRAIALEQIAGPAATGVSGWKVAGVWQYSTEPSLKFGGFSALLPVSQERLRAFSDRGFLFTFIEPDSVRESPDERRLAGLPFNDPSLYPKLWDIESATRDPAPRGDYWVAFENTHAIHRFSYRTEPEEVRLFGDEVDWYANSGLEAMVRLADGRFFAIPEGRSYAMIWAGDPIDGGAARRIPFENPTESYAVTDMAQLPDGRVLLLMRNVAWGLPPFAGLLAIADPPPSRTKAALAPRIVLRFEGVLPPENYEGLAVREQDDGTIAVWIMSDDNISAFQRTLLAKLVFDPGKQSD